MTPLDNHLAAGAVLFAIGAVGFLTRRNLILMMLSSELMLHGVSLNLVAFSAAHGDRQGQSFTALVLTVAACEAGLGLALTLALYRRRKSLDVALWRGLGEGGTSSVPEPASPPQPRAVAPAPSNPPAEPAEEPREAVGHV